MQIPMSSSWLLIWPIGNVAGRNCANHTGRSWNHLQNCQDSMSEEKKCDDRRSAIKRIVGRTTAKEIHVGILPLWLHFRAQKRGQVGNANEKHVCTPHSPPFFWEVDIESDSFVALKNRHCRRYWGICKVSYHSEAQSWIGQKGNQHDGHGRYRSVANESGCFLDWKSDPLLLWEINTASWKRCRFSRFGSCQEWAFLTFKVIDYFATKCYLCFHGMYVVMFGGLPLSTYLLRMFFGWFGYSHTVNACPGREGRLPGLVHPKVSFSRRGTWKKHAKRLKINLRIRKPSKISCKSRKKRCKLRLRKKTTDLSLFGGLKKCYCLVALPLRV